MALRARLGGVLIVLGIAAGVAGAMVRENAVQVGAAMSSDSSMALVASVIVVSVGAFLVLLGFLMVVVRGRPSEPSNGAPAASTQPSTIESVQRPNVQRRNAGDHGSLVRRRRR